MDIPVRGYTPPPPGLGLNDVSNEFTGNWQVSSFEMAIGLGLNMEWWQSRYELSSAHEPAHGFDRVGKWWRAWRITMRLGMN
jgi:hypothetical protein